MENIAAALAESGWTVDILSPVISDHHEPQQVPGVTHHDFPYSNATTSAERILNTVRGAGTFRRVTRDRKFDVVLDNIAHFPYYPAHFLCPDGAVNALFMHTAFFGAAKEYNGFFKGTVISAIDRTLPWLNRPEIICAGESTEARIREKTGYKNTRVLHPTVETDGFEFQFDPKSRMIVYLGRLGKRKNVGCLLRAWQRVERSSDCDLTLVVAGSGPQEAALRELAARLNLQSVKFLGYVSESEKRRLFSESLLCVLPSKMEGYVTTGLEALASGTPVVGSNTVGINDYIKHGETGYLFPIDDHDRLATLLLNLTDDPEQLRPVAEEGRKLAREHSFDRFRQRADALFSSLV
jgi:glycosyltransferase involved in cell wall biosynthesis